jgi:dolichyl-phosphate beta-glucosyltransferase
MNAGDNTVRGAKLSVVIPVYKEHGRLVESLQKVTAFIASTPDLAAEAIFVDDGSADNTAEIIREHLAKRSDLPMRLVSYKVNRGKGYAVKAGVLEAGGDLILMSDADLSTPLGDWLKLKTALDEGADIACGSRAVHGAHIGKPPPFHRRVLSRLFNLLVRAAGVHGIRDTQCGFKLFRADAARKIFDLLQTDRFAFDVEVIALARDLRYQVAEVPVNWNYSDHSTVRLFSSGFRMMWDVFLLAFRRTFFGKRRLSEINKGKAT